MKLLVAVLLAGCASSEIDVAGSPADVRATSSPAPARRAVLGADFDAATLHSAAPRVAATQYQCEHHPEVVSSAPGSCPKCGMMLVPVSQ